MLKTAPSSSQKLSKDQMMEMNKLFKRYGGIRNTGYDKRSLRTKFNFEESLWDNVTMVTHDNS